MANELRTRDGLPFNFVDGLRIKGVDVTNWDKVFIDQGASYVGFTPVGNLAASNVQAAIAELESEKQSKTEPITTAINLRPGANQGVVWDIDAFGGGGDSASITLETAGGEATKMRFKMTNDSDDNFEFTAKSGDGLTAYNNAMTLNGNVLLNTANYVDYAAPMISDYTALRGYTGNASQVRITANGLAGFFYYDASDTTSVDNGGTIIVSNNGKRWKRLFDGAVNVKWFGAKGDWSGTVGTDDAPAIQDAINSVATTGGIVLFSPGLSYRIMSGLVVATAGVVIELNGSKLVADFLTGNAVTVGNNSVLDGLGIKNGTVISNNTSTTLNGVVYKKNVRRNVQYGGLRVVGFKGIGIQFEELNWSIQAKEAPLIESCGINLDIHDNGNALMISGAGLDGATTYNVRLRGTFGVTFVGGYNQFAGSGGVLIDTSVIGALQPANSVSFYGTYFEGNGVSHIVANNGRGLTVNGCYMNAANMTGPLIEVNNWTGAFIQGNNPNNTSGRNFVNASGTSSLICVSRQAVTSQSDTLIGGAINAFVSDAAPVQINTLPAASILNLGSQFLLNGTGTGQNRSLPYICVTSATGTRTFRRMALHPVKQAAQSGTSTYAPNLSNAQCFDLTVPSAGMVVDPPTGPYEDGDEIIFLLKQPSAPTAGITWNGAYKTDLSTALIANAYGSVTFRWSAGRSLWIQTAKMEWAA